MTDMSFTVEELQAIAGLMDAGTRAIGLRSHSDFVLSAIKKIDAQICRLTEKQDCEICATDNA